MKIVAITLLCLIPLTVLAQNPMGMDQEDMQKMMQQMYKAQACMEKIDQSELKVIEKRQQQFEEEVGSLCASGKRDVAQKKAMVFAKEMTNSKLMKSMKECNKMMAGMTEKMTYMNEDEDYSDQHVCDAGL